MSKTTVVDQSSLNTSDSNIELSPDVVAQYLIEHPSFLIENTDVLLNIQVALQENGVVSLTQIQAEQYREKIKQLQSQLEKLVNNARINENIYKVYALLNIAISKANSSEKLVNVLQEHLLDQLDLEDISLVLLPNNTDDNSKPLFSEIQHHAMFEKKLARNRFYLGRLGKLEKETLFPKASANSVAIVQIGEEQPIGLLAIASKDATHFSPNMDTTLLDFLRLALNAHIPRIHGK